MAPQSPFDKHSTHRPAVVSQSGCFVPAQSWVVLHPTHAPVDVLQIGRSGCVQLVFAVHAAWHWWSAQHAGFAAPQSELLAHASHRPSMQRGSLAGQSESPAHSTHPSVPLQIGC